MLWYVLYKCVFQVAETRAENRTYRPRVELCRDVVRHSFIEFPNCLFGGLSPNFGNYNGYTLPAPWWYCKGTQRAPEHRPQPCWPTQHCWVSTRCLLSTYLYSEQLILQVIDVWTSPFQPPISPLVTHLTNWGRPRTVWTRIGPLRRTPWSWTRDAWQRGRSSFLFPTKYDFRHPLYRERTLL